MLKDKKQTPKTTRDRMVNQLRINHEHISFDMFVGKITSANYGGPNYHQKHGKKSAKCSPHSPPPNVLGD